MQLHVKRILLNPKSMAEMEIYEGEGEGLVWEPWGCWRRRGRRRRRRRSPTFGGGGGGLGFLMGVGAVGSVFSQRPKPMYRYLDFTCKMG